MNKKSTILSLLFTMVCASFMVMAQPPRGPFVSSRQVHADKTVTFGYFALLAREVKLCSRNCSIAFSMKAVTPLLKIIFISVLTGVVSIEAIAQNGKLLPVLIVDGFSNHDWKQTTKVTKWILESSGRFKVDVSTIPSDSIERSGWRVDFTKYAVVVQNTNNIWEPHLRWPEAAENELEKYVANGGGLYILHSGNNAFSHWKEYDKMIGLGWRSKETGYALEIDENKNIIRFAPGEGEDTGHGERFNALIQILNRHPINKDYPEQWQTANTEVYYFPRGSAEDITVLSYAYDSTHTHRMWPVEWVVAYGKGRVYNSSMGHLWKGETYPPAYRCVGFQTTVIRAAEWLATGKTTYRIPNNFPTKDLPRLRDEDDFIKPNTN